MWLFCILLGFAGFVLSLFALVWRGFDRNGRGQRELWIWMLSAACFFGLWLFALPRYPAPFPN
ncbi:MAG TPA: hypothetical protein VF719_01820 [Abditibacteriaceae bacterium]|jgi:hypothetical protein